MTTHDAATNKLHPQFVVRGKQTFRPMNKLASKLTFHECNFLFCVRCLSALCYIASEKVFAIRAESLICFSRFCLPGGG